MADEHDETERSEDPTPKRLEDAIKRGDVVKSAEVNTWFMLAGGAMMLMVFAGPMTASLQATLRGVLANSYQIPADGAALATLAKKLAVDVLGALGIPFMLLAIAALAGNAVQHRIVLTVEPITPRLAKISPIAGLQRLFSLQALANFAKGLAKLVIFGGVLAALLWPQRHRFASLVAADPVRRSCRTLSRWPCGCLAPWSPSSPSWRPPITCSSTGSGTSGRKCRCGK